MTKFCQHEYHLIETSRGRRYHACVICWDSFLPDMPISAVMSGKDIKDFPAIAIPELTIDGYYRC